MKKASYYLLILGIFIVFLLGSVSSHPVFAQDNSSWAPQQRIPGYDNGTSPPILIADQNRTVHAFSSQWLNQSEDHDVRVIMYNQWSLDRGWTKPVDILSSPISNDARLMDAFMDDMGKVHVIFFGGDNIDANIYYSSALITDARNAHTWSTPILVAENAQDPENGVFYIDEEENLFVLYAGKSLTSGLYTTSSEDGGYTWSKSILVFNTHDSNNLINELSIYRGDPESIVAIWNEITEEGQGRGIYCARKKIGDIKWSNPFKLAEAETGYGTNTPAVIEYHNIVYALYNLGGIIWQRTYDGEKDWTPPLQLFFRHTGVNGSMALVVDGNDELHLFFGQRNIGSPDIHGMWESDWLDNQWSQPEAIVSGPRNMSGNNKSFDPFDAHAVVSQGNVILVTWRTDPGNGTENENGVWYSYNEINIPPFPVKVPSIKTDLPSITKSITENIQSLSTPTTEATELHQPLYNLTPLNPSNNPANYLLIGAIPSIIIVLVILVISPFIRRYKSR